MAVIMRFGLSCSNLSDEMVLEQVPERAGRVVFGVLWRFEGIQDGSSMRVG